MRAAVLKAPDTRLEIVERDVPEPGPGEILIKMVACGMCFSEVNQVHGHYPFARFPVVPGHEVSGVVAALGEGVDWPEVGTPVGSQFLYSSCGHCDYCVRGDQILCTGAKNITGISIDGGYAEYYVARAGYVTPIPAGIDPVAAAPLMCAGITAFNGLRHGGAVAGSKVAVLGTGGVGTMAVRFAAAIGARVAVVSRSRRAEDEMRRLGAETFIATEEGDPAKALQAWDGGADLLMNTAPSTAAGQAAFDGLRPDGTLLFLGYSPEPLSANVQGLVMGRKRVMGMPSGSPHDMRDTLAFAAAHGIVPDVTPVTLDDSPDILAAMEAGTARGRSVIRF
ncbi:alcohol dehydrogenase catalytic domain-containing protein [Actinomadura barringtoniae]|uniref:Alcohol dehydrogenase catalytic domain-containing protein n=1 Tax=Actinomadura barringtoniae TaxID=1427535 RepID=A0A939PRB7_9ACTN|nr:alcohol dehydrogenase catalytic domain-containing protein [Actinomadura barringtoniae]MBO2453724.1 alcohol dehydrogenase catalytic domain-containing protein [Actinomadura barringtoniae]